MPLTPYGSPHNMPGLTPRMALLLGAVVLVLGGALALSNALEGFMLASFGVAMICLGGLLSERGPARLLLALGIVSGVAAFGAALLVVLGE